MYALVHHRSGSGLPASVSWEAVADPTLLDATDAVVRVTATSICRTDLQILAGHIVSADDGRVLGHEAVGVVEQVGAAVRRVAVGDRVVVTCVTSCGLCRPCHEGRPGLCTGGGGWLLGNRVDGTQAELVRVPFADTSTHPVPDCVSSEDALLTADLLPTAYELGALAGRVGPGDVVAVVGAGAVGLAAVAAAGLFSPGMVVAVDRDPRPLERAKQLGADHVVDTSTENPVTALHALTSGRGADVVIEAGGSAATFELALDLVRPGGRVAAVGRQWRPATIHLEWLRDRSFTLSLGVVDTTSVPVLLNLLAARRLDARSFVTHRLGIEELPAAYALLQGAQPGEVLKVVLS